MAVPFAGDLRPDFRNSQPLNFFKNVFFHLSSFFLFFDDDFFPEKPSFDTARFQLNIRGVSVIWRNHDPKVMRDPNDGTRDERETKGQILTGR